MDPKLSLCRLVTAGTSRGHTHKDHCALDNIVPVVLVVSEQWGMINGCCCCCRNFVISWLPIVGSCLCHTVATFLGRLGEGKLLLGHRLVSGAVQLFFELLQSSGKSLGFISGKQIAGLGNLLLKKQRICDR
jgi:hypothetical protein